ncbi:hypothetical protein XMD420_002220 [Marinobacterium sp. xm-d-420]|nr:hypothetical protein [Marinobacterium sp. xm-d-420]
MQKTGFAFSKNLFTPLTVCLLVICQIALTNIAFREIQSSELGHKLSHHLNSHQSAPELAAVDSIIESDHGSHEHKQTPFQDIFFSLALFDSAVNAVESPQIALNSNVLREPNLLYRPPRIIST